VDLAYLIRQAAASYPESQVARLADHAERFANLLDVSGVRPGAAVGLLSENRIEYLEVDLGIALARRVRVALNARLHVDDYRYQLKNADATVLVHSNRFANEAQALKSDLDLITLNFDETYSPALAKSTAQSVVRSGDDEDPAWITYTSGTTGVPKGVVLSQRAIREVALNLLIELGPVRPGEELVLTQALSHGAGYFVLPWLLSGASLYITSRFDADEILHASRRPGAKMLKIVPSMIPDLLLVSQTYGYETIVYGASPISLPVLEAALERFGPNLIQVYGQSEAPVTLTILNKRDHELPGDHRASVGRAWRSVATEVRDQDGNVVPAGELGELTVQGSHHMTGYRNSPDATAEVLRNGWIWTHDMAVVDQRRYIYLQGRRDEIINSGGYNIAPKEVERVILEYPGIEECVVIGVPDAHWGTAVNAVVRPRHSHAFDVDKLIEFVKPRLGFRTPKRIKAVADIPRTPYGKVDRTLVLALLAEK
jgi:fatty-acyl-CoA synthase